MTKPQQRTLLEQIISLQDDVIAQLQAVLADLHNYAPVEPKKRSTQLVKRKIVRLHRHGPSQQRHKLGISLGHGSATSRDKRK